MCHFKDYREDKYLDVSDMCFCLSVGLSVGLARVVMVMLVQGIDSLKTTEFPDRGTPGPRPLN